MSKTSKASDTASRHPGQPYRVLVWRGTEDVTRLGYGDPLEALLTAITYLRRKYHVRLSDATCDALEDMAPELERLLPSEGGTLRAARGAVRRRVAAAQPAEPRGGAGAVPVGQRLQVPAVPAVVFCGSPALVEAVEV